jgi:exodeoxyribonuclease VII large subunit
VDDVAESLDRAARVRLDTAGQRAAAAAGRLETLSPLAVLARGYSIVQTAADGRVIRRAQDVAVGEVIRIRPAAGEITAVVSAVAGGSSPEGTRSQSAGRA